MADYTCLHHVSRTRMNPECQLGLQVPERTRYLYNHAKWPGYMVPPDANTNDWRASLCCTRTNLGLITCPFFVVDIHEHCLGSVPKVQEPALSKNTKRKIDVD